MSFRYGKSPSPIYPAGRVDIRQVIEDQEAVKDVFDDEKNTFIDNSGRLIDSGILIETAELHDGDK